MSRAELRDSRFDGIDPPDDEEKAGLLDAASPARSTRRPAHEGVLQPPRRQRKVSLPALIGCLGLLFAGGYLLAYIATGFTRYGHQTRVNVILCVSDGFGPASETFARAYVRYLKQTGSPLTAEGTGRWSFPSPSSPPKGAAAAAAAASAAASQADFVKLPLDDLLIGQSRTRSSNSLVTDSAAGATAFACGIKSYNGAIAVDPHDRQPCATVLEAAKHKGYLTGLAVTSRITHATPAAFYAHVVDRDEEERIAAQLVGTYPFGVQVDYAVGGGRCFFLPNSTSGSCRNDGIDLIEAARDNAFTVVTDPSLFVGMPDDAAGLGTLGLFGLDHLNYEADRVQMPETTREPSLRDMSKKMLSVLADASKSKSAHGFFALIEGSRIDMAAHSNDPVGHLYDILAYQEAMVEVKAFVDAQNAAGWPTVMISVSDHETGGMALARQLDPALYPEYLWLPDAIENATHSTLYTGKQIADLVVPPPRLALRAMLNSSLGLIDPTEPELATLEAHSRNYLALDRDLADMLSRRAQIGWSTSGHSGVDVNLYAYGYQSATLRGSRENTEIGAFIERVMDLSLLSTTRELRVDAKQWHRTEGLQATNASLNGVTHYHHADPSRPVPSVAPAKQHLYLEDPPR